MSRGKLRALAAAATPGPWFFDGYCRVSSSGKTQRYDHIEFPECEVPAWKRAVGGSCSDPPGSCHGCPWFETDYEHNPVIAYVEPHHGDTAAGQRRADAEYLAAVSPDVVIGLLDEIDRLCAELEVKKPTIHLNQWEWAVLLSLLGAEIRDMRATESPGHSHEDGIRPLTELRERIKAAGDRLGDEV